MKAAWDSNDLDTSMGLPFLVVVTIAAWPAVVALWLGWRLAPPIRRLGDRLSGRSASQHPSGSDRS